MRSQRKEFCCDPASTFSDHHLAVPVRRSGVLSCLHSYRVRVRTLVKVSRHGSNPTGLSPSLTRKAKYRNGESHASNSAGFHARPTWSLRYAVNASSPAIAPAEPLRQAQPIAIAIAAQQSLRNPRLIASEQVRPADGRAASFAATATALNVSRPWGPREPLAQRKRVSRSDPARAAMRSSRLTRASESQRSLLRTLKTDGVKTGNISRDEELIVLRQLVPTVACRKPRSAGTWGFWSSLVNSSRT